MLEQSTPKALPVALVQASTKEKVLYCEDGLSFWGGMIDMHK
jgi:predicted aconitase with swiveling domain